MNTVSNLSENLLFLSQKPKDNELFELCIEFIKRYKLVLLLTSSSEDLLCLIQKAHLDRYQMECMVIVESDNMHAFIQKLLELQRWAWLPTLIVVDLRSIIDKLSDELQLIRTVQIALKDHNSTEVVSNPKPFFQQLALFVASLMEFSNSVFKKLSVSNEDVSLFSVLVLKAHSVHLTYSQIELLINLYYYSNNAFNEKEVRQMVEMIKLNSLL